LWRKGYSLKQQWIDEGLSAPVNVTFRIPNV
jgi:hypothetical protein